MLGINYSSSWGSCMQLKTKNNTHTDVMARNTAGCAPTFRIRDLWVLSGRDRLKDSSKLPPYLEKPND